MLLFFNYHHITTGHQVTISNSIVSPNAAGNVHHETGGIFGPHNVQPPPYQLQNAVAAAYTGSSNSHSGGADVAAAVGPPDFSPTGSRLSLSLPTEKDTRTLEPIANSPNRNYRVNNHRGKDDRPWFNGRADARPIHCVRPARCEPLANATCFGSRLPYGHTSLDLTDAYHQSETRERLRQLEALRHVPRCWAVVQPFLCAVLVPKCEPIAGREMVYLPSLEMCRITMEPCRLLYNSTFFPEFLRCNETLFPSRCNNDVREVKFNTTGECAAPLVATDAAGSYYADIEGCGVQCQDPLYTDDEHRQAHSFVFWGGSVGLVCSLLAALTYMIDWPKANKYPTVCVFYMNVCYAISCAAWLAQFVPGNREDIVCRKDGTRRHAEPSAGENLSCMAVFAASYYALVAAMVWSVILALCWHLQALRSVHLQKKSSYFHLVAWSVPLVLTIATLAWSEVDASSVAGICFVGYVNSAMRAGFVLAPLAVVVVLSGVFTAMGMRRLVPLGRYEADLKPSRKIHENLRSMGIRVVLELVFMVVVVLCQVNEFGSKALWEESLRKFIV